MLAGDASGSVVSEVAEGGVNRISYTAYGHRGAEQAVSTQLGYNGEVKEGQTGCYLLGNGYRAYNPVLMKFHSPDSLSPFGKGGVNPYAYCGGDSINNLDLDGHSILSWLKSFFSSRPRPSPSPSQSQSQSATTRDYSPQHHRSSVSGGPAVIFENEPVRINFYGLGEQIKKVNPLRPEVTVDKSFRFLGRYDSDGRRPATSSPSERRSDISQRPRHPLPHEEPGQQRAQPKRQLNKTPTKKLEQPAMTQEEIRNKDWMKRREAKAASKQKFHQ